MSDKRCPDCSKKFVKRPFREGSRCLDHLLDHAGKLFNREGSRCCHVFIRIAGVTLKDDVPSGVGPTQSALESGLRLSDVGDCCLIRFVFDGNLDYCVVNLKTDMSRAVWLIIIGSNAGREVTPVRRENGYRMC